MLLHQTENSMSNFNFNGRIYKSVVLPPHFHSNYELVYVMEGSLDFMIGKTTFSLQSGEMLLLNPNLVHAFTVKNASVWIGVFSEDHIPAFAAAHGQKQAAPFRCDAESLAFLKQHLFTRSTPELFLRIACLSLVCSFSAASPALNDIETNQEFSRIMLDYLSAHLQENITLRDAAEYAGYEYHYFSSLFHRSFQMDFKKYLNFLRFDAARRLLSETDRSITEIALDCGFAGCRNFNRVFRELAGITPTQYRRTHK